MWNNCHVHQGQQHQRVLDAVQVHAIQGMIFSCMQMCRNAKSSAILREQIDPPRATTRSQLPPSKARLRF
eukprot:4281851-Amphidinium_carterae.1